MIDFIKKYFGSDDGGTGKETGPVQRDVRVATCALFLEMANADNEFSSDEEEYITDALTSHYGMSGEDVRELTELAQEKLDGSIDLWRFTNLINQNYSREEKIEIVEMFWRLIYADGRLDAHENYLVRKLGKMLRITDRELINAKLAVLHEADGDGEETT